ncbi:MAG: gamma-glutamyl-gamma-aminobutyrate hydrolase family protein [Planctomycetes bacterium]|nr:gamma-glutamyl-gamma-aminobutyrate hydrolase family protein [Planctomycetota bacterium]
MKPLIGINADFRRNKRRGCENVLHEEYVNAVRRAGGLPIILPVFGTKLDAIEALGRINGLLLSGGDDINPDKFGQKKHPKLDLLVEAKEKSDFWLAQEALKSNIPILGICYGHQLVNVILGGTLIQDIPSQIGKKVKHSKRLHKAVLKENSLVKKILGLDCVSVYSSHHQAVEKPGKGLKTTAVSPIDGIIEACEGVKNNRFLLCLQWHPEVMNKDKKQMKLFGEFIKNCR